MFVFIEKHVEALLVGAFGLLLAVCAVAWVQEHDARILAEQTVKQSQDRVSVLEKQSQDVQAAGAKQVATLQAQAKAVTTPAQAIQAIPQLSDVTLNARPAVGLPDAVTVDAVPLFKELNECKQDAVKLSVCSTQLGIAQQVEGEKDTQIKALKKKKSFWARVKKDVIDTTITVGIGAALGYAAHR